MTKRWVHPWWLHAPAAVLWIGFLAYEIARIGSWPDRVPLRYGFDGFPVAWGSPWIPFALVAGLGLVFLSLSAVLDELWARQEARKRFNPLTLLDELVVGLLVGTQLALFETAIAGATAVSFPWAAVLSLAGGGLLAAGLLERLRPFVISDVAIDDRRPEGFREELESRIARGERIVYWDVQNPRYVAFLSLGVPAALWIGAGFTFRSEPWAAAILVMVGLILLLFYGGQRTRVTNDEVTIRYGLVGLRVFRCSPSEISSVAVRRFAALREFGGYGIRFAGSTIGYFLAGSQGVEIGRPGKRSALIGSDHPRRLAEVLGAVGRIEPTTGDGEREDA